MGGQARPPAPRKHRTPDATQSHGVEIKSSNEPPRRQKGSSHADRMQRDPSRKVDAPILILRIITQETHVRRSIRPLAFTVLSLVAVHIVSGCAFLQLLRSEKLKTPEITYLRTVVKTVASDRAEVDFVINATNPNKIGLKNITVDYELF